MFKTFQIARGAVLGSGEFGVVYFGVCKSESVAVKTFKRSVATDEFKAVVLAEVKMMAYLGDHENIVRFMGADISEIARSKHSFYGGTVAIKAYGTTQ